MSFLRYLCCLRQTRRPRHTIACEAFFLHLWRGAHWYDICIGISFIWSLRRHNDNVLLHIEIEIHFQCTKCTVTKSKWNLKMNARVRQINNNNSNNHRHHHRSIAAMRYRTRENGNNHRLRFSCLLLGGAHRSMCIAAEMPLMWTSTMKTTRWKFSQNVIYTTTEDWKGSATDVWANTHTRTHT